MLKKTFIIFLITILFVNIFGTQIIYYVSNYRNNYNIDEQIRGGDLKDLQQVTFTLNLPFQLPYSPSKFVNEFTGDWEFQGNLYRFVKSSIIGNKIQYTCVTNLSGKKMIKAFAEDMANKNNSDKPLKKSAKQLNFEFLKNYVANSALLVKLNFKMVSKHFCNVDMSYITIYFFELPVPPPEVYC